jgi:hypothetical protein
MPLPCSAAMKFDISRLLDSWEYKPGQVLVRRFKARDGREKIQLRLDLGVLQMNAEGRPDGKRPLAHESYYHHLLSQLEKHRAAHDGSDEEFVLSAEDCARLQQEAIQYHHRYICFYQLGDYLAVVRDAERNLEVFDFVDEFAETDELSWALQQFRPQLLLMLTRARGMIALEKKEFAATVREVEVGIAAIREFYNAFERPELAEQSGEIASLEQWLVNLRNNHEKRSDKPEAEPPQPSERQKLEQALQDAVSREDYEQAARVRDALRNLKAP